jgi:ubiquinone/menaquinone biosynthesis C-methylase UbiE
MTQSNTTSLPYGETYGGDAPLNYERFFVPVIPRPLGEELVQLAVLRPGERVLDVACGTGIITRLAIERVGPSGSVAGLDLNPGMLAVARSLVSPEAPVRWYESSAESIPIPDGSFDVVLCQLGLQFVPDREATLKEMRRVLAANGRLLFNVPRPSKFFDVLDEAMEHHVGPTAAQFVRAVFSMNDPVSIERMVKGAGFRDVMVRTRHWRLRLPPAREFLWQYVHCTPLTAELAKLDTAVHTALEREVVEKWKLWAADGGLSYEQEMIVVTARK